MSTGCWSCFSWALGPRPASAGRRLADDHGNCTPELRGPARPTPGWRRLEGLSRLARASSRSPEKEALAVFQHLAGGSLLQTSERSFEDYLCEHLGYGRFEARTFCQRHGSAAGQLSFKEFRRGYPGLNPFLIASRAHEIILRKPGALAGQQVNMEDLRSCEVYICDPTAQTFVDSCVESLILVGVVKGALCIRDCQSCTVWAAAQQVRVKNCRHCTFHIYSKTPPTMVDSEDLTFAPWSAGFAQCAGQFRAAGLDVERNFWNAVVDFSSGPPRCRWRIAPLDEVVCLSVHADEPGDEGLPSNPCALPTHASLCLPPLEAEQQGSCLAGPQIRPRLPDPPLACRGLHLRVEDTAEVSRQVGAASLNHARTLRQQKQVLDLISKTPLVRGLGIRT